MRLICNRTQNDAIWGLIALFLTNQIAGNTSDFKMNVINWRYTFSFQYGDCYLKSDRPLSITTDEVIKG